MTTYQPHKPPSDRLSLLLVLLIMIILIYLCGGCMSFRHAVKFTSVGGDVMVKYYSHPEWKRYSENSKAGITDSIQAKKIVIIPSKTSYEVPRWKVVETKEVKEK